MPPYNPYGTKPMSPSYYNSGGDDRTMASLVTNANGGTGSNTLRPPAYQGQRSDVQTTGGSTVRGGTAPSSLLKATGGKMPGQPTQAPIHSSGGAQMQRSAPQNYGPGYDSLGNPAFHGSNKQGEGRYDRRGVLRLRYANQPTSGEGQPLPPQQSGEGAPLIHPSQQAPRPNSAGSLTAQNPATLGPRPGTGGQYTNGTNRPPTNTTADGVIRNPPHTPSQTKLDAWKAANRPPGPNSAGSLTAQNPSALGPQPQVPTSGEGYFTGQQWRPDWNPGQTRDTYSAMTPEQRQVYDQYMANQLPWNAAAQNALQWGAEFGEQGRRFDLEYGRNMYNDTWQQGFSRDQFTESQRQANFNQAQQMRYANEDMVNSRFERGMRERSLQEQADQFRRQQGLAETTANRQYGLDTRSLDHRMSQDVRQANLAERGQGWQEEYGRGQLGLQGQGLQNDYQLGMRNADLRGQEIRNQNQIAQMQNALRGQEVGNQNSQFYAGLKSEDAWRTGQLRNQGQDIANRFAVDQRGLDLRGQELYNQNNQFGQRLGFDRESLQGNLGVANRGLDIEANRWTTDSQIRREQLAQERELEMMRLKQANLATIGRAVGPNVKWLRNA